MTGSQQRGRRSGRVEDILDLLAEVSVRIDKAIKPLEKAFDWIIFAALLSLIAAASFPSESLALFGLSLVLAVAVPWVVSALVWEKLGTERQRALAAWRWVLPSWPQSTFFGAYLTFGTWFKGACCSRSVLPAWAIFFAMRQSFQFQRRARRAFLDSHRASNL
jgi:hypothetical protein